MPNEIWRPVPEWEGLYEVSSTGRVRSINRVSISRLGRKTSLRGRVLKQRFGKHYYKVGMGVTTISRRVGYKHRATRQEAS